MPGHLVGDFTAVYPRVCGGTFAIPGPGIRGRGLSPRVRGNRIGRMHSGIMRGSIPACAGEPGRSRRGACRPGVYPRVCGGTVILIAPTVFCTGLSPRVRGNPGERGNARNALRSIPACAGEPVAGVF